MHTLAELNPKVGDSVFLSCVSGDFKEYLFAGREGNCWLLRHATGSDLFRCTSPAQLPIWTVKPQPKGTPMKTLYELNPKVGDTVLFHSYYATNPQEYVLEERADPYWYLRPAGGGELWWCSGDAKCLKWTLKPQPEKKVTVAELNLSVGDRVTDGKREGTVSYTGYPYTGVLWDWGTAEDYRNDRPAPFTKLTKPEPTLADLNLKVGDCFKWDGENWIVTKEKGGALECRGGGDVQVRLEPNRLANEFKKLEVPK